MGMPCIIFGFLELFRVSDSKDASTAKSASITPISASCTVHNTRNSSSVKGERCAETKAEITTFLN
jgi:hypothetical protein